MSNPVILPFEEGLHAAVKRAVQIFNKLPPNVFKDGQVVRLNYFRPIFDSEVGQYISTHKLNHGDFYRRAACYYAGNWKALGGP